MDTLLVPVSCLYTPFFLDLFQHLTLQEQSLVKRYLQRHPKQAQFVIIDENKVEAAAAAAEEMIRIPERMYRYNSRQGTQGHAKKRKNVVKPKAATTPLSSSGESTEIGHDVDLDQPMKSSSSVHFLKTKKTLQTGEQHFSKARFVEKWSEQQITFLEGDLGDEKDGDFASLACSSISHCQESERARLSKTSITTIRGSAVKKAAHHFQ